MKSVIIPLVKCKTGSLSDVNNYRAIAISAAVSKLFESVLSVSIKTEDYVDAYQFGFSAGCSTSLCTNIITLVLWISCVHVIIDALNYFFDLNVEIDWLTSWWMLVYLALIQYFIMLLPHSCTCVILVQITLLSICVTFSFRRECVFTVFIVYILHILCIPVCPLSIVVFYGPCCLI